MVRNCQRLVCSLNRPKRACNDTCRRKLVLVDTPCDDCEKLKKEIVGLKAKIAELTAVKIDEPVIDEPTVEDKPKRKTNKR